MSESPVLPTFDRLLAAVAAIEARDPSNWLPFWLQQWERGGLEPVALPGLEGPGWVLLREDEDDDGPRPRDRLVLWRPEPDRPWEDCPVLLLGRLGDLDLVAGSVADLVELTLQVGNLILDMPRDAASVRNLASTVQTTGRRALEELRAELGLAPVQLEALGARLAAAHAAIDPRLDPPLPPPGERRPERWSAIQRGPRFVQAFQGGRFQVQAFDGRRVEVRCETRAVARLVVGPAGQVALGDLLAPSELPALPLEVTPGEHPVFLSLARFPDEVRVAAMALLLDDAPPARWERGPTFDVDAGVAGFADAALLAAIQDDDQGDQELHALRLQRGLARRERPSWSWTALEVPGQPGNLVAASSGWGDGIYTAWLGKDAQGRVVAVVAGFAIVPGDEAEGETPVPAPPAPRFEAGQLARRLELAYNRVLQGKGDLAELADVLAPDVELAGPGEVSGRHAVLRAIATERRLGGDPISIKEGRADGDRHVLHLAFQARPTVERGKVRITVAAGQVARVAVDLVPMVEEPAPVRAAQRVPPEDVELAEALGELEPRSPVKRVLVADVRRRVLALQQPLTDEQRRKARELLGR